MRSNLLDIPNLIIVNATGWIPFGTPATTIFGELWVVISYRLPHQPLSEGVLLEGKSLVENFRIRFQKAFEHYLRENLKTHVGGYRKMSEENKYKLLKEYVVSEIDKLLKRF